MFLRDIIIDQKAPAFAILSAVIKHYGTEILQVDPSLLRHHIEENTGVTMTDLQSDKLHAAVLVATTNQYEMYWIVFEKVTHLFNNKPEDTGVVNPLEAEEIIMALAEVLLIKHSFYDDDETIDYSEEVRAYVGLAFHEYGFSKAPKLFPTAIMPKSVKCDDSPKNEAFKELFDARAEQVMLYLEKL